MIDGKYVTYRPEHKVAYTGSSENGKGKASSFLAFMNMKSDELRANFTAAYLGEATLSDGTRTIQLQLTPKTKTNFESAELWIDADGMPRQWKIVENDTYIKTVLLTNLKKNPSLKRSDFEIALPKGTKVEKT